MSIGIICASGSLGTMIPPSIVLIIYGLTTQTSITMLFQEAIVPGLMISGLIISYVLVRTRLQPHLAPLSDEPALTFKEKDVIPTRTFTTYCNSCNSFRFDLFWYHRNYRSSWHGCCCNFNNNLLEEEN